MNCAAPKIIGITPFESPNVQLALDLNQSGALGVVDLGRNISKAKESLEVIAHRGRRLVGVRVSDLSLLSSIDLPASVSHIIAPYQVAQEITSTTDWLNGRALIVQVKSASEAKLAAKLEVAGLIAKGCESAGDVGEETSFVLLQSILKSVDCDVWVQGGVGIHSAAACIAIGAKGVVVDSQLALLDGVNASDALRKAITSMDGGETKTTFGFRHFHRHGSKTLDADCKMSDLYEALGVADPAAEIIPISQDAVFASQYAKRYASVGRFVSALERAVDGHLNQAQALNPLAPNSPIAQSFSTQYPIFQGPMTRVSDQAAFAKSVAQGGGFPFLALSLMHSDAAVDMLTQTREALGDKPWGVGMLGFAPKELYEHQLELVLEAKPKSVLLAGGRPSQARPLEQAGISTFLHVPSQGLLDAFIKDGAKRFVFEGRECGGHVGPKTSFILWEQAIERLLEENSLEGFSLLFAGGIHDALSASIVSLMTAPLAARGAEIGVIMGTAYLFTHEAVADGAITQTFQDEARECSETALVETAPGHATRCVRSPFVDAFEAERAKLEAEGRDSKEIWAELEKLNLGRLRIASKGLVREGDELVQVDTEQQRLEGMYMIGQVAALRDSSCSIAELHENVSAGSKEQIDSISREQEGDSNSGIDIAIVGAACVYPGSSDLETYWSNVVRGFNAITEIPESRWDINAFYDPDGTGEKTPSKWGAFLDPIVFEPTKYGIPPNSLAAIDPTQLLSLHVANGALEDAGLSEYGLDRERTGVIFGVESGSDLSGGYAFRGSYPQYIAGEMPKELADSLPALTEDSFSGVLANVVAGRIANRLDLRGPNYTVDAACGSSLAALSSACKELSSGSCDVMIAGGADLHNGINDYLMFASAHALSPTGQCRSFDANADGIALGEGAAAVVLKRLSDAERDGDKIYAVIKGIGASSDGKAFGLTAPRKDGQIRALERAYEQAGISPSEVGMLEAHGTGTVVGDRTELSALTELFDNAGALPGTVTLGSVKSQIGHTKCAAGMAGLIKAMLSIQRGVLLPTHNITSPNPGYSKASPFVLRNKPAPWLDENRTAGVSAFGFGGSNFHAVITAYKPTMNEVLDKPKAVYKDWPTELFVFRGEKDEVAKTISALKVSANNFPVPALRDLAASTEQQHADKPIRCALVCQDVEDLLAKLELVEAEKSAEGVYWAQKNRDGKVAFLFPGQGSQSPGMLAELFVAFPELRSLVGTETDYLDKLFPRAAYTPEENKLQLQAITDTRIAQPVLGMVDLASAQLLNTLGVKADMLAGHSYGELVALAAAGAYDAGTLIELSKTRANCLLDASGDKKGSMAAISGSPEKIREVLGEESDVTLANFNSPDQVVIAGEDDAVDAALIALGNSGIAGKKIPVACAFHSPLVKDSKISFSKALSGTDIASLSLPVFANSTAAPYANTAKAIRETLAEQLVSPVRFTEQVEAMYEAGARVFVEAGPRSVLTGLVGKILKGKPHVAIACGADQNNGLASLLDSLGALIAAGVEVNPRQLFENRAQPINLGEVTSLSDTAWLIDGGSAQPHKGQLPSFAMKPLAKPVAMGSSVAVVNNSNAEDYVREFLRNSSDAINAQRDVLLSYFGTEVTPLVRQSRTTTIEATGSATQSVETPKQSVSRQSTPAAKPRSNKSALELLTETISERTGYPAETLGPDLELEADLGIDSIKRLEIISTLRESFGLSEDAEIEQSKQDEIMERLAGATTMRSLAELLEALSEEHGGSFGGAEDVQQDAANSSQGAAPVITASSLELLTQTISDRTGYPIETLEPDLELEADLGIDSIKRLEVVSTMRDTLGLGDVGGDLDQEAQDKMVERLAGANTLRSLAALLDEFRAAQGNGAAVEASAETAKPQKQSSTAKVERYEVVMDSLQAVEGQYDKLDGKKFVICGEEDEISLQLAEKLSSHGAQSVILSSRKDLENCDGIIFLNTLSGDTLTTIKSLFKYVKDAAQHQCQWVVAATRYGGRFGTEVIAEGIGGKPFGICGFVKSVSKEYPNTNAKVVDFDHIMTDNQLVDSLVSELVSNDSHIEVGYVLGARLTPSLAKRNLTKDESKVVKLDSSSVILITGGARGITAQVAIEMAKRFKCKFELLGRTEFDKDAVDIFADALDMKALRIAIVEHSRAENYTISVSDIEKKCRKVMAEREIRNTLDQIAAAGGSANYHSVDVNDSERLSALVDELKSQHGSISGLIHGAGQIEDKMLKDKNSASFTRVFSTKVDSANLLVEKLADQAQFMAFFSSVSSTFGNAGQTDYAAANDVLDKLAHQLNHQGVRALSVNWGPWQGVGMVSPELEVEYQRRGIKLIEPVAGVNYFCDEVIYGSTPQVVITATGVDWSASSEEESGAAV